MGETLEIREELLGALGADPSTVAGEPQLLEAMKLFELGRISSGTAAALVGIARVEFWSKLGEYGSRFQLGPMISSVPSKLRVAPHAIDRPRMAIVIADTSPHQYVLRSDIEILPGLFGAVLVPEVVRNELLPPSACTCSGRGRRVADALCANHTETRRTPRCDQKDRLRFRGAMFAGRRIHTQLCDGDGGRHDD